MSPIPVCVRLSLWGTRVLGGHVPSAAADRLIGPDLDGAASVRPHLDLWAALGERVVLCALPQPGHPGMVPSGSKDLLADAMTAGECVFVPTLGGALVPVGADGEPGVAGVEDVSSTDNADITWRQFDADPVEPWRLDALSVQEVSRHLNEEVRLTVDRLAETHQPWSSRGLRSLADAALGSPRLGLPDTLPTATRKLIGDAAAAGHAARLGLEVPDDGGLQQAAVRRQVLRSLSYAADAALAAGTNIAALHLAGIRGDRRDDW